MALWVFGKRIKKTPFCFSLKSTTHAKDLTAFKQAAGESGKINPEQTGSDLSHGEQNE